MVLPRTASARAEPQVRRGGLLFEVHSQEFNIETVHDSDAIRADVAVLVVGHRRWSPSLVTVIVAVRIRVALVVG